MTTQAIWRWLVATFQRSQSRRLTVIADLRQDHGVSNTPFYGYVVCGLSAKVENWLEKEKNFKTIPDRLGWFYWFEKINLYIEVLSWDKVLRDAEMRNRVFFKMLGI